MFEDMFIRFAILTLSPFSGIFLWSTPSAESPSTAIYCQLTQIGDNVAGDCYSATVSSTAKEGVNRNHFTVKGQTDGEHTILKYDAPFNLGGTWGVAIARPNGFLLQFSDESGIHEIPFHRASVTAANKVLKAVTRRGALARSSYDLSRSLAAARTDLVQSRAALTQARDEMTQAMQDSIQGEVAVTTAQNVLVATRDSVIPLTDRARGSMEAHVGWAEVRLATAQSHRKRAIEQLEDARQRYIAASIQIRQDSAFIASHR